MFIGCYTLDKQEKNYIYYKNKYGLEEWEKDTFRPDTENIKILDFTIKGKSYQEKKENARQLAIDWQLNFACLSWSYGELFEITSYFEKIGKRYGLLKELKENAIC
jgi:hypothetical protein